MRLDRFDSYLHTFRAQVTAVTDGPDGTWLALDRSAFYPTSGGQPNDTGTITFEGGGVDVTDVELRDATVWHRVEPHASTDVSAPRAPRVGSEVTGHLNMGRRLRHMQRHTAQHLLSACLVRLDPSWATVGVSMRGPDSTIEVTGELSTAELQRLEAEANSVAREARAVTAFEVEEENLPAFPLRRPAKVHGLVRLVAIAGYDVVACGGTHLRSTAEALPIIVLGAERIRGGNTRLTFRAGEEAFSDHREKHDALTSLSTLLSAQTHAVVPRVERALAELGAAQRESAVWRSRLADRIVADLLAARISPSEPLLLLLEGDDAALLDDTIERCQQASGSLAFLASHSEGEARLAFVAGPGVDVDVRPLLKAALTELGGRGGGRPDRAQGAAPATRDELQRVLRELANR